MQKVIILASINRLKDTLLHTHTISWEQTNPCVMVWSQHSMYYRISLPRRITYGLHAIEEVLLQLEMGRTLTEFHLPRPQQDWS